MNQKGQALIEALIAGVLCLLSLYLVFIFAVKIIRLVVHEEQLEEQYLCQMIGQNNCMQ